MSNPYGYKPKTSNAMQLFNRYGDGGREITEALGLISDRVDFDTWRPLLPLGTRDVVAIVGREPVEALAKYYNEATEPDPDMDRPLAYLQQTVALFTWLKIIPTLDAQHDSNGRARRYGENEKGLTALEQYKDEANILRLAYEAADALVEELDLTGPDFWLNSAKYRQRAGLLIRNKDVFDEYYRIGSHRLFLTLLPIIREVQNSEVAPIVGRDYMAKVLDGEPEATAAIFNTAARAVALLTMKKAVERLPVEVLPEGIVQINQSTPVNQRLRAEKEARLSVAASLGEDGRRCLQQLEDEMLQLRADGQPVDYFVPKPLVHSRGMSF